MSQWQAAAFFLQFDDIIVLATEDTPPVPPSIPQFGLEQISAIADFILQHAIDYPQ